MAIFIDMDGCIRENNKSLRTGIKPPNVNSKKELIKAYNDGWLPKYYYITKQEDIIFRPRALEALKILHQYSYDCFIVTNQEAIELGIISREQFEEMIQYMNTQIINAGGRIKAWYYCPHSPYEQCMCRKPSPFMLKVAACEHDIDLTESWMIGDNITDIRAGQAAGCKTIQIDLYGQLSAVMADVHTDSLYNAIEVILSQ